MRRFLILIGIVVLTACSRGDRSAQSNLTHGVAADDLSAEIVLTVLEQQGQLTTVAVVMKNPSKIPLQSIRSWVQFDPLTLRVQDLGIVDARFSLFAPGEWEIDRREGLIKLGAASAEPVSDAEVVLATFTVLSPPGKNSLLSFYDWRDNAEGHTAVLVLREDAVLNILRAPSSLSL